MYFIIESQDQLGKLGIADSCFVQVISTDDRVHPKLSGISLVYYNNFSKGYVLCVDHSESYSLDSNMVRQFLSSHGTVYVLDKKYHSYFLDTGNCVDVNFSVINDKNELKDFECDNFARSYFYRDRSTVDNPNRIVPISKQYEYCECLYESIRNYIEVAEETLFERDMIEAYKYVEEFGLGVIEDAFLNHFNLNRPCHSIKNGTVYTYYNLYNLTQRPTNAFNGFNALAIPKNETARSCVVPKNDAFLEFDFDSYHLRIICELIGYEPPKESFHEYLGKQYFSKESLTEEEYAESKKITFRQLYGGVEEKYQHINFFSSMESYVDDQYSSYRKNRGYVLPTGRIIKPDRSMNKYKLFNYIVQNLETKYNVEKILKIREELKEKNTKLVLITYDSFLFDVSASDGKDLLIKIKSILEEKNTKTKYKYAKNLFFR
jgi:hypothetical protein